ncbi:MAG: Putative transmembrane AMP-binding acyltransferase family protein [Candidatus Tokpelaia hoelldobleri]|uniref:Transmembrane AMP-binding acyltransferase family protein n=1 Tax=Candidatus Tokpelaia hoelldobleri TaxID=1902579 RepID=A0A1U9JW55_9HYPH|nr:MAG: Putative transmembrane AMP-binding acyltransferase family protein [Candidatus Tokpelaia hoelldoblerii]
MSGRLIFSRRFAPLFLTQALAAFNDNFLKFILGLVIINQLGESAGESLNTLAAAIFIAPFLALSSLGGELADKYDKATLARLLKGSEIAVALVAALGFYWHSIALLLLALFGFGVGSALFGPVKYAILPALMRNEELAKANAWIEGATFAAILGGTQLAVAVFSTSLDNPALFAALMVAIAVACYGTSLAIPKTGRAAPSSQINRNIFTSTTTLLRDLYADKRLFVTALISCWFWLVGALMITLLIPLVKNVLGGNEALSGAYLALFTIAVALGSACTAWLVNGRIVLLLAPLGTFIAGLFTADLAFVLAYTAPVADAGSFTVLFTDPAARHIGIDFAGIAFFGAMIVVPGFAALQQWAHETHKARIIASANVLSAACMAGGTALVALAQLLGAGLAAIFAAIAACSLPVSLLMLKYLPTSPLGDLIKLVFRIVFRLEIAGTENLDHAGRQPVFALNHISFLDAPLSLVLSDRKPVFAIHQDMIKKWWVKPFLKLIRAIPVDPSKPIATRTLIRAVQDGNPLVIFPEGRITTTGSLMKIYDGAAMVADKTGSPIIPVRIDGLERTPFSHLGKSQLRKRLFPKVRMTILPPEHMAINNAIKGKKRRQHAGTHLYHIMSNMIFQTNHTSQTLLEATIDAARKNGMKHKTVQDPLGHALSYGKLLTASAVLARKFARDFHDSTAVGVMLPTTNGAAAVFLGLISAGKVPAMLNFSAGLSNLLAACRTAQIRTLLTSRAFIRQARLDLIIEEMTKTVGIVYIEDLRANITFSDKIGGILRKTKPLVKKSGDDPAVILFTSGSESLPKGVVLSHNNIIANTAQAAARIDFNSADKLFNTMPFFHSFGLTVGLVLPLVHGVPVYLYPSPLHYRIIPELIYSCNATIILGTDTFLTGYARTANPYDLRSLRLCIAGAEPVKDSTRQIYMEKFGLRILEGYGVTETAPVIALNTPMSNKTGTVGKMLPGMEYRLEPVPGMEEGGRLLVKGPNVMAGYLLAENPGMLVPPPEGWHDTGDIVTIDEEGFIRIVGRAKRFAKIGGEMISLAAIEKLADEFWPNTPCTVAALKDARKGERLVLITEAENADRAAFMKFIKGKGATDLSLPSEIITAKVPLLGSGKVDFAAAMKLAESLQ